MRNKMRDYLLFAVVAIFVALTVVFSGSCGDDDGHRDPVLTSPVGDKTTTHVVRFQSESEEESIKRWLMNLMTNKNINYDYQLQAARVWVTLGGIFGFLFPLVVVSFFYRCRGLTTGY